MISSVEQLSLVDDVEGEDDSTLASPHLLEGVVVTDSDWTAETILSQVEKQNILLNPRFQRREAWDDRRKSRFIESLILGLPIPQLVLSEMRGTRGRYLVIDGKQRLLSLVRFAGQPSQFDRLVLKGLEIRSDLNGVCWDDMRADARYQSDVAAFENASIRTTVIKGWKEERALYLIFHRLNSGSVPLSPQELRHVLHPGPFIDFAFDFSESSETFIAALGNQGRPDFRMRDVELLIRFIGFALFLDAYSGDLKQFLDRTVENLNRTWVSQEAVVRAAASSCATAMDFTIEIFGPRDAFSKWSSNGPERRFNRAVFDVMTYYFSDDIVRSNIKDNSLETTIRDRFINLCTSDSRFMRSLETTTKSREAVLTRLWLWGAAVEQCIGIPLPKAHAIAEAAKSYAFQ